MRIRRRGFTLVEVMVTVAIMAIVSAISFPIAHTMYLSVRLDAAGDSIRSSWADGQSHAMNEAVPYRFSYIPGTGKYRLAPDSDDYWTGGDPPARNDQDAAGPVVLAGRLPQGVFFQTNGSPATVSDDDEEADHPKSDASHEHTSTGSYQKLLVFFTRWNGHRFHAERFAER
jgi:prepilin-type N-terminal cleavage/methylation domain-containing protein